MADLKSLLAQGRNPFENLLNVQASQQRQQGLDLQNIQEQRLAEAQSVNIEAAKQQAIQAQQKSQLEGIKTQQQVLIDMGRTEDAMRLMPQVFQTMGADIPFDVEKLIEADKTKKINFADLLKKTTGIFQNPKSSDATKKAAGQTLLGIISEAGKPDGQLTPTQVGEQQEVAPQVQPQATAQISPQDKIREARNNLLNIQQQFPQLSQTAQGKAAIKTLEDSIKFEEGQLPKITKEKGELLTGTAAELFGVLSTSSNADDVKRANKMKEFARLSTDDVGAREREKRNAQIDTAAELEAAKLAGQGKISPKTQQNQSKKLVTNVLVDVKDLFQELKAAGAAVDIKQGSIQNLSNAIASSDIGQFFGKGFGTEEQSIRNELKQKEPILLNAIRQATKQGARGLDSDRELDFYLQAITDVGRDIDSQMSALKVLDEAYGLNLGIDVKISNLDANKRLLNRQAKDFADTNQPTQVIDKQQVGGLNDAQRSRLEELRRKRGQ